MDDDILGSRIKLWSFHQGNSCSNVNVLRQASQLVIADGCSADFEVELLFQVNILHPTCLSLLLTVFSGQLYRMKVLHS